MKRISYLRFVCVTVLSTAEFASSVTNEAFPQWLHGDRIEANLQADSVLPVQMGGLSVILEKTTLAEVANAVGTGKVTTNGDAAATYRSSRSTMLLFALLVMEKNLLKGGILG
jgi:hypothetical protein